MNTITVFRSPLDQPLYYWALSPGLAGDIAKGISFFSKTQARLKCSSEINEQLITKTLSFPIVGSGYSTKPAGAINHAYYEAIERYVKMQFCKNRAYKPKLFSANSTMGNLSKALKRCIKKSVFPKFYYFNTNVDVSVIFAYVQMVSDDHIYYSFGAKAGIDRDNVALGALEEAISSLPWIKTNKSTKLTGRWFEKNALKFQTDKVQKRFHRLTSCKNNKANNLKVIIPFKKSDVIVKRCKNEIVEKTDYFAYIKDNIYHYRWRISGSNLFW